MKKPEGDQYPGFAPPRQRRRARLLIAILMAIGVTCFVLILGPLLVAMALVNAMGRLFVEFGLFIRTLNLVVVFLGNLIELLWLLQTAQPVKFAIRLLQTLTN
jgi:hypothetical protein